MSLETHTPKAFHIALFELPISDTEALTFKPIDWAAEIVWLMKHLISVPEVDAPVNSWATICFHFDFRPLSMATK